MGEQLLYQPLTREDKITVVLYRAGIVLSTLIISLAAYMSLDASRYVNDPSIGLKFNILLAALYISVGLSVFFIHLYVSKFHKTLKKLYYLSLTTLAALFYLGKGNAFEVLVDTAYGPLLLIPLSGCLGFVTAKEAFCFKLVEGYILALFMPLYLLFFAAGASLKTVSFGLVPTAALLLFFAFRKVFQPIHYDIGDKSAYH